MAAHTHRIGVAARTFALALVLGGALGGCGRDTAPDAEEQAPSPVSTPKEQPSVDPVEAGCLAAFPNDVDECVRVGGASQFARRDELAHGYSGVLGVHLARIIVGDGSYAGVKALSALDGGDCEFMASLVKSSGGDEAYFTESCRAALMAFAADASSIATTDEVAAKVPDALTFLDVPTGVFEAYAE